MPEFGNVQFTSPPFQRQVSVRKPHTLEIRAAHPYLKKVECPPGLETLWKFDNYFQKIRITQKGMLLILNATNDWMKSKLFLPAHPGNQQSCLQENSVRRMLYDIHERIYNKRMLIAQDCVKFRGHWAGAYCIDVPVNLDFAITHICGMSLYPLLY